MNKELIKKYKNEFDYWLYGGSVLLYSYDTNDYKELSETYTWNTNGSYIINDEFVKFRKALLGGKIIQWECAEDEWVYLPEDYSFEDAYSYNGVQEYRIKEVNND